MRNDVSWASKSVTMRRVLLALKGTQTAANVTDAGDGSYSVEYTPSDIGNFWTPTVLYSQIAH